MTDKMKEPHVIIRCGDVNIPVPVNILAEASAVFKNKYAAEDIKLEGETKKHPAESIIHSTAEMTLQQENKGKLLINIEEIDPKEFSKKSVEILFYYLKGFPVMLETCSPEELEGVVGLCTKYEIKKALPDIVARFKTVDFINLQNLAEALEVGKRLKDSHADLQEMATELIDRCIMLARCNLGSRPAMLKFLAENKYRKETVVEILRTLKYGSTGILRWRFEDLNGQTGYPLESALFIIKEAKWKSVVRKNTVDFQNFYSVSLTSDKKPYHYQVQLKQSSLLKDTGCDEVVIEAKVTVNDEIIAGPMLSEGDLCWVDKEMFQLIGHLKSQAELKSPLQQQNLLDSKDDSTILLEHKGDIFAAKKSILIRESPVFASMFGESWNSPGEEARDEDQAHSVKDLRVVSVPDNFDPASVQILIGYLNGSKEVLKSMADIGDMLSLCDYYGIYSPIEDILNRLKQCNMMTGYEVAQKIGKVDLFKDLKESLLLVSMAMAGNIWRNWQDIMNSVLQNESQFDAITGLATELVSTTAKSKFRFKVEQQNMEKPCPILVASNMKWMFSFQNFKSYGQIQLGCTSFNDEDMKGAKVTAVVHLQVFNPQNWSPSTVCKSDRLVYTSTLGAYPGKAINGGQLSGFAKDGFLHMEATIKVLEAENLPKLQTITEKQIFAF